MRSATAPPTVIFLSVHKGASTFLAAQLAPAICREMPGVEHLRIGWHLLRGTPMSQMTLPPTGVVATRVYPAHFDQLIEDPPPAGGRFADKHLVMVRRDPRDAAVSLFYSKAYSHRVPPGKEQKFLEERARLQAMSPADGIWELTSEEPIEEFRATTRFLERFPQTCLVPYELLVGDFERWYRTVADHLQWSSPLAERIAEGLAATVQPPAAEDPHQHKRRVTPGNWREVFDERLRALFEREIGSEMAQAGYDW
ncbi:MAG: hypothetical protein ACYTGC_08325 [Planctomycetota bacterium]